MVSADLGHFGELAPGRLDRLILAMTSRMPVNWLGLRLAILLRRAVTMRLAYPDGALDVQRWGMRMRLHPRDNGCEKNLLFTPQMYETIELNELAADIAKQSGVGRPYVFVDIGANVGLFSLFVAARAGEKARVLAVEPEPGNLCRLYFNLRANPTAPITVLATALSDRAGDLAIELNTADRGGSRTRNLTAGPLANGTAQVSSRTLLDVLSSEQINAVDALKIDVEGAEDVILRPFFRDAAPALWPRLIIIEDSSPSWKVDLMAIFAANGYAIHRRSKQNIVLSRHADDGAASGRTARSEGNTEASHEARS